MPTMMGNINCWGSLLSTTYYYNAEDAPTKAFITKYMHGWLVPLGKRRRLIDNGNNACLYCGLAEHNEHMMMCQDTKALFHQRQRITVLTAGIFKNQGSRKVTKVWLAQVKNFMHNQLGTFQPILSNTASESIKGPIREALTHQNKMGAKLNLQGYMSIKWREALGQQARQINGTSAKSKIWVKTAISHL